MGALARARPVLAAVAVAALLLGGRTAAAGPAVAAGGACPGASGVTVVVDSTALGGGVSVRCAPGAPASGLAALTGAGFAVQMVLNVPKAVCRINNLPGPDKQDCVNMPPGNAFWSYWHASRGGSWAFAQGGAGSWTPRPGSVEGWAFSTASPAAPPAVAPPAAPSPTTPTPSPTRRPTAAPTTRPTPGPGSAAPSQPVSAVPSQAASPSQGPTVSPSGGDGPSASPGPTDTPTPGPVATADAPGGSGAGAPDPPAGQGDPGAPPVGTLLGAGLVVGLLAGGSLLARRGRAAER